MQFNHRNVTSQANDAEQADVFSSAFAPANASACAVEESLFDASRFST